ncbi:MAG: hypothetical protein ACYDCK_04125 [Thermoplasmatota archaeon]
MGHQRSSSQRPLSIAFVLLVAAPVSASIGAVRADAPPAAPVVADAAALAWGVPLADVNLTAATGVVAWTVADATAAPTLTATNVPANGLSVAALVVSGVDVFTVEGAVHGTGALVFAVDGVEAARFTSPTLTTFEAGIDEGMHTLTWTYFSNSVNDTATLLLHGVETLTSPVLQRVETLRLGLGCELPTIRAVLAASTALPVSGVRASLDGIPLNVTGESRRTGFTVGTDLTLAMPPLPEGPSSHALDLTVRDATGHTWQLARFVLSLFRLPHLIGGPEPGWVYDPSPMFAVDEQCPRPGTTVTFALDGNDMTRNLSVTPRDLLADRDRAWTYSLGRTWQFNESHAYVFRVVERDGTVHLFEGTLREGLDHLDLDVRLGRLTYNVNGGRAMFDDALDRLDFRAVSTSSVGMPTDPLNVPTPRGVHIHALYAPLALVCRPDRVGQRVCSPYGGDAPGFFPNHAAAASATFTSNAGRRALDLERDYLGQFVAAAYFSRVMPPTPSIDTTPPPNAVFVPIIAGPPSLPDSLAASGVAAG